MKSVYKDYLFLLTIVSIVLFVGVSNKTISVIKPQVLQDTSYNCNERRVELATTSANNRYAAQEILRVTCPAEYAEYVAETK